MAEPEVVVTPARTETRVAQIRRLDAEAQGHELEASERRWKIARLVHDELEETGKTQRAFGGELDRSHTWVRRMRDMWRWFGDAEDRPIFQVAWAGAYHDGLSVRIRAGTMHPAEDGPAETWVSNPVVFDDELPVAYDDDESSPDLEQAEEIRLWYPSSRAQRVRALAGALSEVYGTSTIAATVERLVEEAAERHGVAP